tara:strand:+ start:846 stop:1148 length:303 start_codon:yes stop_codon:yes gene_type:complete
MNYNEKVANNIFNLPESLLARYIRYTELMKSQGPNLGMPHTKHLEKDILELRLKGKEGIARVIYCTIRNNKIMMLHSFIKKTQETPKKELNIARKDLRRF